MSRVWSMQTVRHVRNLEVGFRLSAQQARYWTDQHAKATFHHMFRSLQGGADAFAAILHEADVAVYRQEDGPTSNIRFTMSWEPETREVELSGGSQDGMRLSVKRVGEAVTFTFPAPPLAPPDAPPRDEHIVYALSGWHEERRCWVYTLDDVTM